MKTDAAKWSTQVDCFDTDGRDAEPSGVSFARDEENKSVIWPIFMQYVNQRKRFLGRNLRILDFGCGTGSFCRRLALDGHTVVGVDANVDMIKRAIERDVNFLASYVDPDGLDEVTSEPFDMVVSLMVLQFVSEIDEMISRMGSRLTEEGIVVVAVHDDDYFRQMSGRHPKYVPPKPGSNPLEWTIVLNGETFAVFLRGDVEYSEWFARRGLTMEGVQRVGSETSRKEWSEAGMSGEASPKLLIMTFSRDGSSEDPRPRNARRTSSSSTPPNGPR